MAGDGPGDDVAAGFRKIYVLYSSESSNTDDIENYNLVVVKYKILCYTKLYSSIAQSVEHAAVNRSVVGSSPTGGVSFSDLEPIAIELAPWSSG